MGDGPRTEGIAGQGIGERGIERAGVVLVEEPEQEASSGGQALPAAGEGVEEGLGMRARLAQAIPAPQLVRAMLGGGERGQVRLGLDALAAVVRAGVARDLRHPVQDAHLMFRGDEGEGPPNQRVRDRVVVAVEAQVGSLAGAGSCGRGRTQTDARAMAASAAVPRPRRRATWRPVGSPGTAR